MKRLYKVFQLSFQEQHLLLQVAVLLILVRIGLSLLPFQTVRRILLWRASAAAMSPKNNQHYQERIIWAVTRTSRALLPDGPCLTQALVAQFLLKQKGQLSDLCLGVLKDENEQLQAHAWLEHNGEVIIGGTKTALQRYVRLPALDGVNL